MALSFSCKTHESTSITVVDKTFSNSQNTFQIQYDNESESVLPCDFYYPNHQTNDNLIELRQKYNFEQLIKGTKSDIEKALILLNWTHGLWRHNGVNEPKKSDALSILQEVEEGKRFRCVEFAIVLEAALNSIGIPARILGIYTKDVETSKCCAGHVVTEAYLSDLKKWIFLDAQMNYIPFLNGLPLNAVEYQNAIFNNEKEIELRSIKGNFSKTKTIRKINWVTRYLYYLHINFNLPGVKTKCQVQGGLILVPLNAKNPSVFQITEKLEDCIYTVNVKDFYKTPIIE